MSYVKIGMYYGISRRSSDPTLMIIDRYFAIQKAHMNRAAPIFARKMLKVLSSIASI